MTEKKLGRPTDNPKNTKLTVRVDAETLEILEKYCKKKIYLKWKVFVEELENWTNKKGNSVSDSQSYYTIP